MGRARDRASADLNGQEFILDADADTSISADTDDQIDIKIAGADDFQFTANTFTAQSGSTIAAQALTATTVTTSSTIDVQGNEIILDDDGDTSITADTDDQIDFRCGGIDRVIIGADGSFTSQPAAGGTIVFNEASNNVDFRVESDDKTHMLFLDGANNQVTVGASAATQPNVPLSVICGDADNKGIYIARQESGNPSDDEELGNLAFMGVVNTNTTAAADAKITARAAQDHSGSVAGTDLEFYTKPNGTGPGSGPTKRILLDQNGTFYTGSMSNVLAATGRSGVNLFQDGSASFSSTAQPLYINRDGSDGELVRFFHDTNLEGNISVSGNTVSYNAFSGSHWSRLADNSKPTILKGTVVETIDEMCDWYKVEYEVDGKTHTSSISLPDGKKVGDTISFTVPDNPVLYDQEIIDKTYTGKIIKEIDNKHTKCKVSDTADSKRVYGVFADWDADDDTVNDMYVTAVGTHVVRINKDVTVTAGDLLSSNGDGTAKVQDDDIIRSKTIGKVLTNLKQETYDDGSYTVPCALYCG
jgi:hypothetical protein